MAVPPAILNIHTPTTSFAIVHSLTQNTLQDLYDTLSRKAHTTYHGARVGPGWLKYEFNDSVWNLDDDSDYTIFVWRQQQTPMSIASAPSGSSISSHLAPPSISSPVPAQPVPSQPQTPTLHLHNPTQSLPGSTDYQNPSYYLFNPARARASGRGISPSPSIRTKKSTKSKRTTGTANGDAVSLTEDGVPKHKKEFNRFHSENGVRTVMGSIGPVQNVRMLLKNGYRHVYISRKFAIKYGFIPKNATLGYYGYSGLVNIGVWPITLTPSSQATSHPDAPLQTQPSKQSNGIVKPTTVTVPVYLSEEPHFDVVLGRSFFEKRKIRLNGMDPTDIVCMDTGEKIECELVILKDGRGEIVTVT